jgi:hypothetical protein
MLDHPQTSRPELPELPDELRRVFAQLQPYYERSKIPVPAEIERGVPEIMVDGRVNEMAHAVGQQLRGKGLYIVGSEIVTINEVTGQIKRMTKERFVSWVEEFISFYKFVRDQKRYVSVSEQRAEQILASDSFLVQMPVLNGVNPVKLPVRRANGTLELLRPGYDPETGIFTLRGGLDYDEHMPPEEARDYFQGLVQFFPFQDETRSRSVHFGAMFTVFASALLPQGARAPIFIYNANQVGSGKTRLAQMALTMVYGKPDTNKWSKRDEEFEKELDSAAQGLAPFLFFDDKKGLLESEALNRFSTTSQLGGRIIGGKERFSVPLRTLLFITGNQLRYSDDIFRRSVICDLFNRVQYDQRTLPPEAVDMTEEWLRSEENRKRILSALWSLTLHAEVMQTIRPAKIARKIGSFEAWSKIIAPIVIHAGLGDPTELPASNQGNPYLEDARNLACIALDELVGDKRVHSIRLAELVPIARLNDLFPEKVGTLDSIIREMDSGRGKWKQVEYAEPTLAGDVIRYRDPTAAEKRRQAAEYADHKTMTSFGSIVKKMVNGLEFSNSKGVRYRFGTPEGARHATYICTRLE